MGYGVTSRCHKLKWDMSYEVTLQIKNKMEYGITLIL